MAYLSCQLYLSVLLPSRRRLPSPPELRYLLTNLLYLINELPQFFPDTYEEHVKEHQSFLVLYVLQGYYGSEFSPSSDREGFNEENIHLCFVSEDALKFPSKLLLQGLHVDTFSG